MNKYQITYNTSRVLGDEKINNLKVTVLSDSEFNAVVQVASRNGMEWSTDIISVSQLKD